MATIDERLDKISSALEELTKRDIVFDKRMEALTARMEALTARHEALSESVEMIAQSLFRRKDEGKG